MLRITKSLFDRKLVPQAVGEQQEQLVALMRSSQQLATLIGDDGLSREIDQVSASALKPFLFVIVGEVKSGKSSLINALLEAPVCGVDSAPCTTRVQEIGYGEEESRIEVSQYEERMQLPHAILRHIAIVDTPGTNSIIREHQRITEDYIPQSDLVLFVFFAKNPYTGSAWDFLRYIRHDWQRNTLFVLQQADLLPADQRRRTVEHIRDQLIAEGIADPVVFPVSVKTGAGVATLRDHLRTEVVEGRQFNKLQSTTHNLLHFSDRAGKLLETHERLNQHDEILLGKLHGLTLNLQTDAEVEKQVAAIMNTCRHHTDEAQRRLHKRFQGRHSFLDTLDTLKNALAGGHEIRQWLTDFFAKVQAELSHALYQDQLRYFSELHRRSQELGGQMLEVLESPPNGAKSATDALSRRREQTLEQVRERLASLDEFRLEETAPPQAALGRLNRLLLAYRLAQTGTAVGLLVLGVYFGDLVGGILMGAAGYVGIGYVLFARGRDRLEARCVLALDRNLADLERRLRTDIGDHLTALTSVGDNALTLFEGDLRERRKQTQELTRTVGEIRDGVERFRAQALPRQTDASLQPSSET